MQVRLLELLRTLQRVGHLGDTLQGISSLEDNKLLQFREKEGLEFWAGECRARKETKLTIVEHKLLTTVPKYPIR